MAWKYLINKYHANLAAFLPDLWATIEAMGWVLHDNQDANSYRVYKSDGELADRFPEYLKIDYATANTIKFSAYLYWDATTHTGSAGNSNTTTQITISASGFYTYIYGNKDLFYVISNVAGTRYMAGGGHIPKRFYTTLTTLTANATAGTNVTITVSSTAGFVAGNYYQIVGAAGEGRDRVQVSSITNSTQMVIANLPRNYGANAKIGETPSAFGALSATVVALTCIYNASGTTATSSTATIGDDTIIPDTVVDPDDRGNAYLLCPLIFYEATNFVGYCDAYILAAPATGLAAEDTLGVTENDSGTSSGSNGLNTLNDTTKAWGANVWAGKVVVIKSGLGAGQIRKIASNTATQLTITTNWTTIPDNSSTYVIVDEAYRFFNVSNSEFAFREGTE